MLFMERFASETEKMKATGQVWGDRNLHNADAAMTDYVIEKPTTPEEQAELDRRAEEAAKNEAIDVISRAQTQSAYHAPKTTPRPYTPVAEIVPQPSKKGLGETFATPAPVRVPKPEENTSLFGKFRKLFGG